MKKLLLLLVAFLLHASVAPAGNWFGAGPWANGAYYPGQFDGVYSASVFNGSPSVISGVLGFGLRNGSPTTSTNSTISTNGTQNTITVDPFQNYFVVYVDGRTFAGLTIANVDNNASKVSGGLFNGTGPSYTVQRITDIEVTLSTNPVGAFTNFSFEYPSVVDTCSGGFTADLTGKKAVISFSGNNTGFLQIIDPTGVPLGPQNTFSLNGMKVGTQTYTDTTATTAQ